MVTTVRERHETSSIEVFTMAPRALKDCVLSFIVDSSSGSSLPSACLSTLLGTQPPKRKDMPRTSSMFDRMEPRSVAFTTRYWPSLRKATVMIISTAFPKVAFRRPLNMSFLRHAANSSVASPRIFASGIRARKFSQKTVESLKPSRYPNTPRGEQTRRRHIGERKICLSATMLSGRASLPLSLPLSSSCSIGASSSPPPGLGLRAVPEAGSERVPGAGCERVPEAGCRDPMRPSRLLRPDGCDDTERDNLRSMSISMFLGSLGVLLPRDFVLSLSMMPESMSAAPADPSRRGADGVGEQGPLKA
mmetsp:Transcript_43337/g.114646  ORF Transcript_43337/g.114646 Transcript_43337/m.114646 type:complete len:305 (+) Transcript_43337:735-1649(+)